MAVVFGFGTLVERSVLAFTVIKYAGAAYIVYPGVQAIRGTGARSSWTRARCPTTAETEYVTSVVIALVEASADYG